MQSVRRRLRKGASAITKAVLAVPGAALIAALLPADCARAQVTGVITGAVTADYSTSTQSGQTVFGFEDAAASLGIAVPVIPVTAATGAQDWSSPATWNSGLILLSNGGITISGNDAAAAGAFMAIPTAAPSLVNTGPTEYSPIIYNINLESTQVPGVNASFTLSPAVTFAVTIPANSNVTMDQQGVAVNSITVAAIGTLTGDGNFTVRSDLINQGQLDSLAGTVQGDFDNENNADVTGALYVQGNFNNTGAASIENGSSVNLSLPFSNGGLLNLYGGTINPPAPLTNNGMIDAYFGMFPNVSNSHTGVIDVVGSSTSYLPPDGTITNAGIIEQQAGTTFALDGQSTSMSTDPAIINNLANGVYKFLGDGLLDNQTSGYQITPYSIFNNAGLLEKAGGSGLSTVDVGIVFNDTGTVEVDSGTLQINGGGGFTSAAFNFKNNGQLVLVHDYAVSGTNTASGTGALTLTYGSLLGGGTLNFGGAAMLIFVDYATIGDGLINAGNMQISPTQYDVFVTGTFTNTGTIQHTAGTFQVNAGSTLTNSGTILQVGSNTTLSIDGSDNTFTMVDSPSVVNNQAGAVYNLQGDGQITNPTSGFPFQPDATFNNAGLFEKTAGTGTSYVGPGIAFSNTGSVQVTSGTLEFDASVVNTGALAIGAGARVNFNGAVTGGAPITNNGTMYFSAGTSVVGKISGNGALAVGTGNPTILQLAPNSGTSTISSLSINPNSTLDIANNTLAINFGSPVNDPVAMIAGYLSNGYEGGAWTNAGIDSSVAATNSGVLSVGYADGNNDIGTPAGPNQIIVKYTLAGDANLDGHVNSADLLAVIQNFNKTGTDWAHGNFTYGSSTGSADLLIVIQNFNKLLTPAGSSGVGDGGGGTIGLGQAALVQSGAVRVPEPAFPALALGVAGLLARRRKQQLHIPQ
jgi:hypothetical protein